MRIRFRASFLTSFLLLFALTLTSETASAKVTSDPNHKGWTGKGYRAKPVDWKPITTKCDKCTKMAEQYNATVQQLLRSRYWVYFWRHVHKEREKGKKNPFWPGKGDINDFESKAVAANLELFDLQQSQLELHRKAVAALEKQAKYLRHAIAECERVACASQKPTKIKDIKVGGESTSETFQPDIKKILAIYKIPWNGPYSTRCRPCRQYVEQLNALPGWVVRAHLKLQLAEMQLQYSRYINKSNKVKVESLKYAHPDKTDFSDAENNVNQIKGELQSLASYFDSLLAQLAACEKKHCPVNTSKPIHYIPAGGETETISIALPLEACPEPAAHEPINVGANSEVGSSADFKEKAKQKAKGLATKAIGKLLGIGGGGGKSKGPKTYKDPIKNKHKLKIKNKQDKRELRVGAQFTPDGLLVSSDIEKAPGKGTFQTIYLENANGWRLLPIRLWLYEIWRNWKLSVSWTRDTYVDGQLVDHQEGGWTESWSELIARGEVVEYAEVPIWQQLGFNTAVSGVRSLGTLFPVTPEMLAENPLNLAVHVTDPKKDPVVTVPYLFQLTLDENGGVAMEPAERSMASDNQACKSLTGEVSGNLLLTPVPVTNDLANQEGEPQQAGNADENTEPEPAFSDRDGDGIEDSIDSSPDEASDEFFHREGSLPGKVVDSGGNRVTVIDSGDDGVTIEVSGSSDGKPAIVEVLGVELELEPGTIITAHFG